jgi:hypothetical protein
MALLALRHCTHVWYCCNHRFLIACGTRPLRPPDIPFDGIKVFDSDQLLWGGVKVGDLPFNRLLHVLEHVDFERIHVQ